MNDDKKVMEEVATTAREWAAKMNRGGSINSSIADAFSDIADRLSPQPPEPEKPMRTWVPPLWLTDDWRKANTNVPYEFIVSVDAPFPKWVPVCIHPADAPHCDKAEHGNLEARIEDLTKANCIRRKGLEDAHETIWRLQRLQTKHAEPRCDVEGHADLERQANDFAVEVERLRRRVSELEALLLEVAVQFHVTQACHPCSEHVQPFDDCGTNRCSRVRAALEPAKPKKVGPCYRLEDGREAQCRTCRGDA